MLGATVVRFLSKQNVKTLGLSRAQNFNVEDLNSAKITLEKLDLRPEDLLVNCIGWIPQKSKGEVSEDATKATIANSLLPALLENISKTTGVAVVQILTDCVFSGNSGPYSESFKPDSGDLYGLSKRLGEVALSRTMGIRCSIVGLSTNEKASLLDWFLSQPIDCELQGYTNHLWNGVTTNAFAHLVFGIFSSGEFAPGIRHWVPLDSVTKFQLLSEVRSLAKRSDIRLVPVKADSAVDRRLATNFPENSESLWRLSGYNSVPSVNHLLSDLFLEEL
jgi:dTDP-4-dehydrorhamnose reductase